MQVSLNGKLQEIKVTSVVLEVDKTIPAVLKTYHCPDCGKSLVRYSGLITLIWPGETPTQLPLIVFCKHCKNQFLFNSKV